MEYIDSFFKSIDGLASLGLFLGGIGFAISQIWGIFTKQEKLANVALIETQKETIATLKETAIAEKAKAERLESEKITLLDSHQKQINELTEKLGKLQGLYEAAERRNKEMLEILQGKDPEMTAILKEIKMFMKQLNEKAKTSEERDYRVDNGPAHKMTKMVTNIEEKSETNEIRNIRIDSEKK